MCMYANRLFCVVAILSTFSIGCSDKRLSAVNVPVVEEGPCTSDEDCDDGYHLRDGRVRSCR